MKICLSISWQVLGIYSQKHRSAQKTHTINRASALIGESPDLKIFTSYIKVCQILKRIVSYRNLYICLFSICSQYNTKFLIKIEGILRMIFIRALRNHVTRISSLFWSPIFQFQCAANLMVCNSSKTQVIDSLQERKLWEFPQQSKKEQHFMFSC